MIKKKNQARERPQCKDLRNSHLLLLLLVNAEVATEPLRYYFNLATLERVLLGLPPKLILAKWSKLFGLGFLDRSQTGCPCGCNSYTQLSEKGRNYLREALAKEPDLQRISAKHPEIPV